MFLVPDWATECTVSTMPSLTVQYMSDSGTVELSRDCGEEGTRHIPCRGQRGAERDAILSELRCIDEAAENVTSITTNAPSTTSTKVYTANTVQTTTPLPEHQSTLLDTDGQTENMEDNTIPNLFSSTPNNGQEDSFMQADEPLPIKLLKAETKQIKKVQIHDLNAKKVYNLKKITKKVENSDELMMGDQPLEDELVHHKSVTVESDELDKKPLEVTAEPTETTTQLQSTTAETRLRRQTEGHDLRESELTTSSLHLTTVNEVTSSPLLTEHPHNTVDESVDHFVPPMLLVRTKFNAIPNPLAEHHSQETTEVHAQLNETVTASSVELVEKLQDITTTPVPIISTKLTEVSADYNHDSTTTPASPPTTSSVLLKTTTSIPVTQTSTSTTSPRFRSPHAPQKQPDHPHTTEPIHTAGIHGMAAHLPHHIGQITLPAGEETLTTILFVTTTEPSPKMTNGPATTAQQATTEGSGGEEPPSSAENNKQSGEGSSENTSSSAEQLRTDDSSVQSSTLSTTLPKRVYNDLSNKDNLQPYKPNRHRSLTRPETSNYIKKLFG